MSEERKAEIMLSTAASGYSAVVSVAAENPEAMREAYRGAVEHLRHAALDYAGSCGNLDAAERAELLALRRFREGVVGLRAELVAGITDMGERVDRKLAIETIDALLLLWVPAAEHGEAGA